MNQFEERFGRRISAFWDDGEGQDQLVQDVRDYANANPAQFVSEFNEVRFKEGSNYMSVVLEALSKDADKWGNFYVEQLDAILKAAAGTDDPGEILGNLTDLAYIEDETGPFVQRIADRLYREMESDDINIQMAAIWVLPDFIENPVIRNRSAMIAALQEKLNDANWKVRYVAHRSLGYSKLHPPGYRQRFTDKLRRMLHGNPLPGLVI
ncbi:MAG TPA: hypothetical protein VD996_07420 [Chitinophagaceae bacterium]|nr:hypothetical protein [Chitinophagaceae bacterium]